MLAELAIVPAIVGVVWGLLHWRSRPLTSHPIEAALLALGLCGIGALDFTSSLNPITALQALSSQTPLAVQLPFLLWAAVRFGPTGVGLTLLTATLLGTWRMVHGIGPYATLAPATTVTAFTLSLILVGVTLRASRRSSRNVARRSTRSLCGCGSKVCCRFGRARPTPGER